MRRTLVTFMIIGMFGGLGLLVTGRERSPAEAKVERAETPTSKNENKSDTARVKAEGKAAQEPTPAKAPATPKVDLDRPLRIVALGWEQLVPGIIANNGIAPGKDSHFGAEGLKVHFRAVDRVGAVEDALAKGGGDDKGADIAIVPLPTMVSSYEDLRALKPQVFFVVGWSRGRDALYAKQSRSLVKLPTRGDVKLVGTKGEPATFMAMFLLDTAGVEPTRVQLIAPSDTVAKRVNLAAVDLSSRDAPGRTAARKVIATTADATSLIPYVAIAPEGFLQNHAKAVDAWARVWLRGVDEMRRDIPSAARKVATVKGAPQPLLLLKRLGRVEFAGLAENARLAGLSGRGAVTIEGLFREAWKIWRDSGTLTTPVPAVAPLSRSAITSLVLTKKQVGDAGRAIKPNFDTKVVLTFKTKGRKVDDQKVVHKLGFVAGVFGRSALRVGVERNSARSKSIIAQTSERFDVPATRFKPVPRLARKRNATIQVLAAP